MYVFVEILQISHYMQIYLQFIIIQLCKYAIYSTGGQNNLKCEIFICLSELFLFFV